MADITIPPAALEAGARAICETENGPCECLPDECGCTYWQAHARAAFLAMIEAWPEMAHRVLPYSALILPLTEKPDDKA